MRLGWNSGRNLGKPILSIYQQVYRVPAIVWFKTSSFSSRRGGARLIRLSALASGTVLSGNLVWGEFSKSHAQQTPVVDEVTANVIECATNLFRDMDLDGSGTLDGDELTAFGEAGKAGNGKGLAELAKARKIPADFLRALIKEAIASQEDFSEEQFVNFMIAKERLIQNEFEKYDKDKKGFLTLTEFEQAITSFKIKSGDGLLQMTPTTIKKQVKTIDANGDGEVDYTEFREVFVGLNKKDLNNVKPFWGAVCGDATILNQSTTEAGATSGHTFAALMAGLVARTVTSPLENVFRLIVTGRAPKGLPVTAVLQDLWVTQGMKGMFKGNGLSVARGLPSALLEFTLLRTTLEGLTEEDEDAPISKIYAAGALSQAAVMGLTHPLDLVSLRFSISNKKYKSIPGAFIRICTLEGKSALASGLLASLIWSASLSLVQYTVHRKLTKILKKRRQKINERLHEEDNSREVSSNLTYTDQLIAVLGASNLGLLATLPLENVRRQMQVQGIGGRIPEYRNVIDALRKISNKKGVPGLFKGSTALTARAVPYALVSYWTYEGVKNLWSKKEVDEALDI